jgi:hypothetical protein
MVLTLLGGACIYSWHINVCWFGELISLLSVSNLAICVCFLVIHLYDFKFFSLNPCFYATQLIKKQILTMPLVRFVGVPHPLLLVDQCRRRLVLQRVMKRTNWMCTIRWTHQNSTKMARSSDNMAAARRVTMCQEVRAPVTINALTRCLRLFEFDLYVAS